MRQFYSHHRMFSTIGGNKRKGTVKWFNSEKGFGFVIDSENNEEIFVHQTAIHAEGFRSLAEGEDIEFEISHYDPEWALIGKEELEYDLNFAKRMYEWRKLEEPKYLTYEEAANEGVIESAFGTVGYKMRAELDYRVIGGRGGVDTHQNYYDDTFVYGPFGTEENPVLVPTRGRYRMVGCVGGYDGKPEHEIAWFALRQGPKHRCPLCGQIFQLWTTDASHRDHPCHDPNEDYEKVLHNMLHS